MTIIDTLKKGIREKSMVKYKKQSIDLQTANVLLTVYNNLSPENKKRFIKVADTNLPLLIDFSWKQVT